MAPEKLYGAERGQASTVTQAASPSDTDRDPREPTHPMNATNPEDGFTQQECRAPMYTAGQMSLEATLEKAAELERAAGAAASCHEFADIFGKAVQQLEVGDPTCQALTWEAWLYQYQLDRHAQEASRGGEFGPLFELADGRRHPPPVGEFPGEAVDYFRSGLEKAENPSARARLADFLWLRTREIAFADQTITEYIGAAQAVLPSQFGNMVATEYLARATALSRGLGRDRDDLRLAIRALAEHLRSTDSGFVCELVRTTAPEIAVDDGLSDWCLVELTKQADEAADRGGQERSSERSVLDAAVELARARKDRDLVTQLRRRIATSFEREADERVDESPLIRSGRLQGAMKAYAALGMKEDLERVKAKVHDASERAMADLKEVSGKITISVDKLRRDMQQLVEAGRKLAPWVHLQIFAIRSLWPEWSDVAARTAELARRFPLQDAVHKVLLGPDGRPFGRPSDPDAARQFDEIQRYVQDVQFRLGIATMEVEILGELDAWSEDLIVGALNTGVLFNDEVMAAIRPGVRAYARGRAWEALHVLTPQIERVVRELARLCGANVYRHVSATGEIHWRALNHLLQLPPVRTILARIRPDLADQLSYLLIDSRGMNLRDDVAHGILPHGPGAERLALLCVLILLTLSLPNTAGGEAEPAEGHEGQDADEAHAG
jgi:hypothetical protein